MAFFFFDFIIINFIILDYLTTFSFTVIFQCAATATVVIQRDFVFQFLINYYMMKNEDI